jgi:lipoate-protein ligase A
MQTSFRWLEQATSDPIANLRLDEELLADGGGVLRMWESAGECVVLGQSGQAERDVHVEACRLAGVPVLRRTTGGGAVLLGPGCLNYTLVIPLAARPECRDVRYSMRWILDLVREALDLPELRCDGQSDLCVADRKVSGNAQRRTHSAILHHGTLLYDFDAARVERFL